MINGLCCGELFHSDLSSDDNYCLMANENMIPGPGGGGPVTFRTPGEYCTTHLYKICRVSDALRR